MKILVTGAGGQLGQDCARVLGTEHTVYAFGSKELDIASERQVRERMAMVRPEAVINCAAFTGVDASESNQTACWRVNAQGPAYLAAACTEHAARLLHVSTDYVFAGDKPVPRPYTEADPVAPLSEYGRSKLAGEEAVRAACVNHLIIRTAWLYGMGGRNFLKTMLRLAVRNPERTIRVVNDQYGSLTWTHRLAWQIKELLPGGLTGTVHATAEGYATWYDGARLFLTAMGVPFSLEPCTTAEYPTPARRPVNSILENSVLKVNGLNRMVPWEEDVQAFARQYRAELLAEARG
ncbi:MAG: dTDP-4-dehydrorhamnose reductase [Desulfobulbaceae bacterium]